MSLKIFSLASLALLVVALVCPAASASQPVSEKGMATVDLSAAKATPAEYREAQNQATLNAIERYVAGSTAAESRNFSKIRSDVASHLSDYVLGATVLSQQVDPNAQTLNIVVRADLDTNRIDNALRAASPVAQGAAATKSYLTFVFMARQQASVTRYGSDTSTLNANQTQENGSKNDSESGSGAAFADEHTSITRSHSSTAATQRATDVKYRVTSSDPVNTAMTGVFTDAGFNVVDSSLVAGQTHGQLDLSVLQKDFATGNDIPPATLSDAVSGVKGAGIHYFAIGTLDVGLANKDPATGLTRVFVTVTGKLYGLNGPFPRTLVSVGPVQYSGLGPTESVAETNALKLAARSAAQQMVQAMDAQGVH